MGELEFAFVGSTSTLFRIRSGLIMKCPAQLCEKMCSDYEAQVNHISRCFMVEKKILEFLGEDPRVVKYCGWHEDKKALILEEASHGSLQLFFDDKHQIPSEELQRRWSRQVIECVRYIHSRGVMHCDIRPENFLIHASPDDNLNIRICDFGGSKCEELDVDGYAFPATAFLHPSDAESEPSPVVDFFGLGSVLYFIQTGHWPYRGPGSTFDTREAADEYEQRIQTHYEKGEFPDVRHLIGGAVIKGCWDRKYSNATEVLEHWGSIA
ncbi:kinase-like domain-containing protein [Mariannaea sp. PMI_226]|nr:kinase-like domain-containing protein [Mariannaea sp. PMI_226]